MKIEIRLIKSIGPVVRKYHIVLKNFSIFQEKPNNKKVTNKNDKLIEIYRNVSKLSSHLLTLRNLVKSRHIKIEIKS